MTQQGHRRPGTAALIAATTLAVLAAMNGQAQQAESETVRPAPRWPDGRISLTGPLGEIGNWGGPPTSTLANHSREGALGDSGVNLETNLDAEDVPFQPWAREVYEYRQATFTKDDPHTRCKPSGGARLFHTPYGFEILDLGDEIIFVTVGAPHSWRVVHMDRTDHPAEPEPSWYGHSIGRWEGDTLVIYTVVFNDKFWISRGGFPHTTQLRTTERISRPDFNRLRYEITIDDPGAYTDTWSGGWYIPWLAGNEPFDYLCQENNLDAARMVGPDLDGDAGE